MSTPIERIDEEIDRTLEYLLRHARLASQMTTEDLSASFEERLRMCVGDCLKIAVLPQSILADDVTDARRLRERAKAKCKPPTPTLAERASAALAAMPAAPDGVDADYRRPRVTAHNMVLKALQAAERGEVNLTAPGGVNALPVSQAIGEWAPLMVLPPSAALEKVLEALDAQADLKAARKAEREQATRRKSRSS